jgi:para-nitrobenzyl esterase
MKKTATLLLLCLLATFSSAQSGTKLSTKVQLETGLIEGMKNAKGDLHLYKGIPFAKPPLGDLRWKAPQTLEKWSGVKNCTSFGPSPMQGSPRPFFCWSEPFLIPAAPISEDCLYLNVWTGAKKRSEKRAVLVYIYGGGFMSGGSGCPIYDGEAMAQKGVVFVSINYRVGNFGFFTHPELSQETDYKASGNYALLDMIAALQWVQKNIAQFGGDPQQVTIAGQSAGAFGINFLCASPLAKGLFQRAIAQSGGSFYESPLRRNNTLKEAEDRGLQFAKNLNCQSLAELRKKTAESILKAQGGFGPVLDGYVLPEKIMDTYQANRQNDVPILLGWNADDVVMVPPPSSPEAHRTLMQTRYGKLSDEALSAYPANTPDQVKAAQLAMGRDETFGTQVYAWAKIQASKGKSPVYLYNFNRKLPFTKAEDDFGAFHSGEIVYAYQNLHTINRPWQPADYQLAATMSTYWANFAKTGNPNGKGLPTWAPYRTESEQVMILDEKCRSTSLPGKAQMVFWEKIYAR